MAAAAAAAAFIKAAAVPAQLPVPIADRCSNARGQRLPEKSFSLALPSSACKYSFASLSLGETHLSVDGLLRRKDGFSALSPKGSPFLPARPRPRRPLEPPMAYLDLPHYIPYPKFTTKPEWWWRTLSCVPYLMALQISDTAFYFVPLMERHEQFEFLSYYIPGAIRRLPSWFLMVYCFGIYAGVVRNRKWPHFFRHHMMMGLLLENCIQIAWYASNFLPLIHYNGTFGLYYWASVGSVFILLLLQCVRCALAGKYVNLPFISDAAYIHTPYVSGDN
ncbi:hypothetical protein MLD38_038027 [Melastoma candidum]|uniref:Uncharacterized protein n=1 Tax=Melastoma candidum TaxID=119954 RepID=A0ACB9KY77_9MYRT|nr:hypothetical protein MLD38_038027 [Melastoma candidum]